MTIPGTILGGHYDHHGCVLTLLDNDGNLSELVLTPDMVVMPDEAFLTWSEKPVEVERIEL